MKKCQRTSKRQDDRKKGGRRRQVFVGKKSTRSKAAVKLLVFSKDPGPYNASSIFDFWLEGCERYKYYKTLRSLDNFVAWIDFSSLLWDLDYLSSTGKSVKELKANGSRVVKVFKKNDVWYVGKEL